MSIFYGRKSVSEVFTPRKHEVNQSMYIDRPELEKALIRAAEGTQHILLYGESGNGKSWLYKKVFAGKIRYVAANCANASRIGSLTKEIESIAFSGSDIVKTGYLESTEAGVDAFVASGRLAHEATYEYRKDEPLLAALKKISGEQHGGRLVIVLENLESIFEDEARMDELANILLLLDDPRYAVLNIKFLIVGTPAGVLEYFSATKNLDSVSNRLVELKKVDGFDFPQVRELIVKGFIDELKVSLTDIEVEQLSQRIFHLTMGVAQRVHEYCEQLAYGIEDAGWKYSLPLCVGAERSWLNGGLRQSYSVVEGCLNSRDTAVARRNQVLFSIGRIKSHQFYSADIEKIIKDEFPDTIPDTNMGIGSILTELSKGGNSLLVRHEKTGQYRVKDPRYTMCIRIVLFKNKLTGKVTKKNFRTG